MQVSDVAKLTITGADTMSVAIATPSQAATKEAIAAISMGIKSVSSVSPSY